MTTDPKVRLQQVLAELVELVERNQMAGVLVLTTNDSQCAQMMARIVPPDWATCRVEPDGSVEVGISAERPDLFARGRKTLRYFEALALLLNEISSGLAHMLVDATSVTMDDLDKPRSPN